MERYEIEEGIYIHSNGALHIPRLGLAAVADLHVGFEAALSEAGASMPRAQRKPLLERLHRVIKELKPHILVVVGDLKHNFDRNLGQEWEEVEEIVETLSRDCDLVVLRGNHDNYLINILRQKSIQLLDTYEVEGEVTFNHGHKPLEWKGLLVMGHEHPSVGIRDPVGGMVKLPCFLYNSKERVLVLPAVSPLARGTDVVRTDTFFSPLLRPLALDNFNIWGVSDIGLLGFGSVAALRMATIEQEGR
ncbi:MAG: metallophosphoesterase [Thermoplasmata archaeon]|nr:metallophosphoesterase [Thermoplasmata archaeon]